MSGPIPTIEASVEEVGDGWLGLRCDVATVAGTVALRATGIALQLDALSGAPVTVLIDLEAVDDLELGWLLGPAVASAETAAALVVGSSVELQPHPGLRAFARASAAMSAPAFDDDPDEPWIVDLAAAVEPLRWLSGPFADAVDEVDRSLVDFAERWLDRRPFRSIRDLAVATAIGSRLDRIGEELLERASDVQTRLDAFTWGATAALPVPITMSRPTAPTPFAVVWDHLPHAICEPGEWFLHAGSATVGSVDTEVRLTTARADRGPATLFCRAVVADGTVVAVAPLRRVSSEAYLATLPLTSLVGVDRIEAVDRLDRPVLDPLAHRRTMAEQCYLEGWRAARRAVTENDAEAARPLYRRAGELFAPIDARAEAAVAAVLAQADLRDAPFLADLSDRRAAARVEPIDD